MPSDNLSGLRDAIRQFDRERDWVRFHSPRNLILSLLVEAGELAEHFEWADDDTVTARLANGSVRSSVTREMADVFIHLIQLADVLELDLIAAGHEKLKENAIRYPVNAAYGRPDKLAPPSPSGEA